MDFSEWEPVYRAILDDFGFDRRADERARDLLAGIVDDTHLSGGSRVLAPDAVDLSSETVAIAGAGPSLADSLDRVAETDVVIAASDAAAVLRAAGVTIDWYVTDLDAEPELAGELSRAGTPVAVHSHGDNRAAIREWADTLEFASVLPTTQAEPVAGVSNVGGFTDGDRAAFLADHCGAGRLRFVGWDFDDPSLDEDKRRKLQWAERLLRWLERRRDEQFPVLDGRRGGIDESVLPV